MNKTWGRRAVVLAAVMFGLSTAGCGLGTNAANGNQSGSTLPGVPSATVGSTQIPAQLVAKEAKFEVLSQPGTVLGPAAYGQALTNLIDQTLVLKNHPVSPSASEVAQVFAQEQSYLESTHHTAGGISAILRTQGLTVNDVKGFIRQFVAVRTALGEVLASQVGPAAQAAYVHAHPGQFEQADVRHILVKSQTLAETLLSRLKNGASFGALAKQYSTDPGSRDHGGEYRGVLPGQMVPPFNAATFGWPVGKIGIVHSVYGWHVLQVLNRKPLALARAEQMAYAPVFTAAVNHYLSQLRRQIRVVVHSGKK